MYMYVCILLQIVTRTQASSPEMHLLQATLQTGFPGTLTPLTPQPPAHKWSFSEEEMAYQAGISNHHKVTKLFVKVMILFLQCTTDLWTKQLTQGMCAPSSTFIYTE